MLKKCMFKEGSRYQSYGVLVHFINTENLDLTICYSTKNFINKYPILKHNKGKRTCSTAYTTKISLTEPSLNFFSPATSYSRIHFHLLLLAVLST